MSRGQRKTTTAERKPGEPFQDKRLEVFCHEYLTCFNAHKAALAAGYTKSTAKTKSYALIERDDVQARLAELQAPRLEHLGITAEMVLAELAFCGFSRITDIVEMKDGEISLRDLNALKDGAKAAILDVSCTTTTIASGKDEGEAIKTTRTSVRLHNKVGSLELLGKNLRLFDKDENKRRGVTFSMTIDNGDDQ